MKDKIPAAIIFVCLGVVVLNYFGAFDFLLSPARNLTGRWTDIQGEGVVITLLGGPHRFHYDLKLDIVQTGNTFTATAYCTMWRAEPLVPYSLAVDDGYWDYPLPSETQVSQITDGVISGTNIEFHMGIYKFTGTFTTDLMHGTVEAYDSGITYSGEFNLRRE